MAFVDDPSQQQQDAQVAGAAPLSTGQATPAAETQPEGSTGAPSGGQIQPQGSSAPKPQIGAKGSGKASSGQYTNIQKYVQKNQPQAQQIAGAVTQDVGKQAQAIQQQAAQKQAQQQQVLQANQQAVQQSQDWATQQLQNIMQGAPAQQEGAPAFDISEDQQKRFQALMRGEISGVQDVGPLNIAEQQAQARQLQQMTGQAETEAGRRQLLGQTFQKQGDYTRGMSGLDQLIVGGQQGAREALIQGVMGQGEQLGQGLQDITGQSQEAIAAQDLALQQATTGLGELTEQTQQDIQGQMNFAYQQELDQRLEMGQSIDQAVAAAEQARNQKVQEMLGGEQGFADMEQAQALQRIGQLVRGAGGPQWGRVDDVFGALAEGRLEGLQGAVRGDRLARVNEAQLLGAIGRIADQYEAQGFDVDTNAIRDLLYQGSSGSRKASEDEFFRTQSLINAFQNLQEQIQGADIGSAIRGDIGMDYQDFLAGKDIDVYDTASEQDISRFNALQQLIGNEGSAIVPEMRQTDYFGQEDLQEILARYGASGPRRAV